MKDLTKTRYSDAHRDDIVRFLESGGSGNEHGILLTEKEEALLDRWKYADELLRKNKYKRQEIVDLIIAKYGISHDTAWRDIVNAEYVFCSSYPLNKKYIIGLRMEFLAKAINKAYTDDDYESVARLEKEYREYLKMYPDTKQKRSPKTINFIMQNNLMQSVLDPRQALITADEIIKRIEENEDY